MSRAGMRRYVWRELVRNPRRTLAAVAGVILGVALFSGLLFFSDGSGATLTARALAPVALDMQRVLTSPLGTGLRLEERLRDAGALAAGGEATVTLRVTNGGGEAAHDVVVQDEPPRPLRYVPGTAALNGAPLRDAHGGNPLSQGVAGLGRNIGTLPAGATVTITYRVSSGRPVRVGDLRLKGRISSREDLVPAAANGPRHLALAQLRTRIASLPGVASADGLAFVDLPPGSLTAKGAGAMPGTLRVFAFDARYRAHYPSIRLTSGSLRSSGAVLSAEASRALGVRPGGAVTLRLPAGRHIRLPVSGVADLTRAEPLFSSRTSRSLGVFLYVPQSLVVSPAVFDRAIIPALRAQSAALGGIVKSRPVEEIDVRVERRGLRTNPAAALAQTRAVARSIGQIAPRQDYLIDNASNTLIVARADAAVAKRMFLFLGLPAVLMAAVLAAYAGGVLAAAQRREQANLRLRGAGRAELLQLLAYRTLAVAGAGSVLGVAAGFVAALAMLGSGSLLKAAPRDLALSALVALGAGATATGLALFVPGRQALRREVAQERRELVLAARPLWRRLQLDVLLLSAAVLGELVVLRTGALDLARGSVSEGRSVSLPSRLFAVPLLAWSGGALVGTRLLVALALRLPPSAGPGFGALLPGLAVRSLNRRSWQLAAGFLTLGLVIAFGTSLRGFSATYEAAKSADARFVVGSDLRITPGVAGGRAHSAAYAPHLRVAGVRAVTPVVSGLQNSVLIGAYKRATSGLAAIDPTTFGGAARLAGSSFEGASASAALASLAADPRGVLLNAAIAGDLSIRRGDRVQVVLALGGERETRAEFRVDGLFTRLAGFARPPDLVVGLARYASATRSGRVDFFLARTRDRGQAGLARTEAALRARGVPLAIETTQGAFDRDQSSLTALDVRSLVDLGSLFTLLMSAAVIAIFTFGVILQRRRDFVVLRAQGMHAAAVRVLVLGEVALIAAGGVATGLLVGACSGFLLVQSLRSLFIVPPTFTLPPSSLVGLVLAPVMATLLSATAAITALRHVSPMEILREP
jgi:putative ABC transport system permease protein